MTHLHVCLSFTLMLAGVCGCQTTTEWKNSSPGALPGNPATQESPRINATTYFAHGHLLERQGSFDRAEQQYRLAIEAMPNFVAARNRLGITLNKLARHAEASEQFREVIKLNPALAYVHNNLGFSYYLEGQFELAAAALSKAIELQPDFRRAHLNHGLVLARIGLYDEALASFKKGCSEPDAYYNLAMVQTEAGNYAEAARSLDMALQLNPRLEAARQQLREVARLAAEGIQPTQPASPMDFAAFDDGGPDGAMPADSAVQPPLHVTGDGQSTAPQSFSTDDLPPPPAEPMAPPTVVQPPTELPIDQDAPASGGEDAVFDDPNGFGEASDDGSSSDTP